MGDEPSSDGEALRLSRSLVTHHAFLVLLLLLAAGCAIPQVPYRTIYEDPINYVRLEEDDAVLPEWPPGHHAHPKPLTADQVTRLLKGMTVKEHRIWLQKWFQGEAPLVPAFKEEEVTLLVPQLVEAFASARYNERITFYLSQPQTSVKRVITSGGLYLHNDQLHVILGNWQIVYGIPTYGMIYDRRYPMRPTAAKGFDLYFEPSDAVVKQRSSMWDTIFANTKDELVIDMTRWESSVITAALSVQAARR
ncbi:MAG TPA: hypothetical protein VL261_06485 [Nitrospira sp.]|jgi:hypothetical protein|nr:hypothetical protein [Nitrospira sp.]